jgi:hypothetical protein
MIATRMGDGSMISMTEAQVLQEIENGISDAVSRAKCPLTADDIADGHYL